MREIPLTQGKVALVDDADYAWLMQWKWHALKGHSTWYALRHDGRRIFYMHRDILGLSNRGDQGDHINGNGLDNQRNNIRKASHAQNQQYKGISKNNISGFKGVAINRRDGNWQAHITVNGSQFNLGYFDTKEEAAAAYRQAATLHHGDFARYE